MKKKVELKEIHGTDYEVDGFTFCAYIPKTELKDIERKEKDEISYRKHE